MAKELTVTCSGSFNGATGADTFLAVASKLDSADAAVLRGQTLSNSPVTVTFPASTGRLLVILNNLGDTNNILYSTDDGDTYGGKVPPGTMVPVFLASGTGNLLIKTDASTTTYDILAA